MDEHLAFLCDDKRPFGKRLGVTSPVQNRGTSVFASFICHTPQAKLLYMLEKGF